MPKPYVKDPDAILDYYINWEPWLLGDPIETSSWNATGTISMGEQLLLGQVTGIWVSGGVVGERATLTNHILTAGGRVDDRTILLLISEQ
jgi:hypothetical protein